MGTAFFRTGVGADLSSLYSGSNLKSVNALGIPELASGGSGIPLEVTGKM